MKLLALAAVGSLVAQVATCTTPPSISTSSVITAATQACQFAPTAETIINLVAANPALNSAELVANAICATVAPAVPGLISSDPVVAHYVVNGKDVPIVGHFTK